MLDGVIKFDLECSYYGDFQGVDGCADANDVCVINDSPLERTAPLSMDATYYLPRLYEEVAVNDSATLEQFAGWLAVPNNDIGVWVKVEGGAVTAIEADQQIAG